MRFFYKILLYFIQELAIVTISRKSVTLATVLKSRHTGRIAFVPYQSADCLALHKGLCRMLNNLKTPAEIVLVPTFDPLNYLVLNSEKGDFSEFQDRLKKGLDRNDLTDLYYPLLDSFIRVIPYHYFINDIEISDSFYSDLISYFEELKNKFDVYSACFLADSAYLKNNIIKQMFLSARKPVYYFNPNGKLLEYNRKNYSEYNAYGHHYNSYLLEKEKVDEYINLRMSGKSHSDMDSSRAFAHQNNESYDPSRKILFLHAFRDANNNNWHSDQPFDSYYEWVEYTFKTLNESNEFHNWYIKVHPSSEYYKDDSKILDLLTNRYSVPDSCLLSPPTSFVIINNMSVFTNSGTIVLELAANGQKAFFCGTRIHNRYGNFAFNRQLWADYLLMDSTDTNQLSNEVISDARYQLYYDFKCKNIGALCPSRAIQPKENPIKVITLMLEQIYNSVSNELGSIEIPEVYRGI